LGNILDGLETSMAPPTAIDKPAYVRCRERIDESSGMVRMVMEELRDATDRIVASTCLADMPDRTVRSVNAERHLKIRT
jgi:hypothetical protein